MAGSTSCGAARSPPTPSIHSREGVPLQRWDVNILTRAANRITPVDGLRTPAGSARATGVALIANSK